MNIISLFVALFGSYRTKVDFDLVNRRHYAFSLLFAADVAKRYGQREITVMEFGVAAGAGLLNMCSIAERTTKATGVRFNVIGFDTGAGMPLPIDYRDFPEVFQHGDFPMEPERLKRSLPSFATLVLGDIATTVPAFLASMAPDAPIGFVAVDVDYYSSAKSVLKILEGDKSLYLPIVPVYLDDIAIAASNPWRGELLAVNEFNEENKVRKISPFSFLRTRRIFKTPQWIDQMYAAHIHDHVTCTVPPIKREKTLVLALD